MVQECPNRLQAAGGILALLVTAIAVAGAEKPNSSPLIQPVPSKGKDRDHWAFRPLRRPEPPPVQNTSWIRNPIDRYILAKLEDAGLAPLPRADRVTLVRRVTFDLTGLPPTSEEVDKFVRDDSPDSYDTLIGRLLGSMAYGERWAQHWLDLARFAETDGFEHDLVRPNAWRYRDWVIDALNADMPYDEFVRLQIAGDERSLTLRVGNEIGARHGVSGYSVATGFLLCGPDMPDINLQDERRHSMLNEMTSTVASVFLGLQIGCAQCHDHKFDPITIADFYRLRAFFEPAEFFDETPLATPHELAERERLQAPAKSERDRIEKELKKFDATAHERLNKDPQVKISRDELLSALSETERKELQKLADELMRLSASNLPPLAMGRVLREKGGAPRASHIMLRGDFRQPGPQVTPAFPAIANPWNSAVAVPESVAPSSGRRTALANWLMRPDHPLTTRVIVNRVWQFHFGQGLVRTPSDFGTMGEKPSHPELLDWLATEFTRPVEDGGCGWSLKHLHKLLLTSATYMQASRPTEAGWTPEQRAAATESWKKSRTFDPDNRLLARMTRLRLDGEAIRDTMLASASRLSPRRAGPGVRPPLPQELVNTLLKGQWAVSPDEEDHRRRSVYIFVRRNLRYPIFEVFDRPDTNASCPQRIRSTTAPQGLTMLNSQLSLAAARDLSACVLQDGGNDRTAWVTDCYRRALGRTPSRAEFRAGAEFLLSQKKRLEESGRQAAELALPVTDLPEGVDVFSAAALTDLCLAIFNLNEFVYLD